MRELVAPVLRSGTLPAGGRSLSVAGQEQQCPRAQLFAAMPPCHDSTASAARHEANPACRAASLLLLPF